MLEFLEASPLAFWITALLLGLIVGSFLNVLSLRLPAKMEAEWRAMCEEFAGKGSLYANVQRQDVRDFLVGIMSEMARDYPVDGLHYDYIRAGENSFDSESEERFLERFGHPMSKATYDDWVAWNSPVIDDIVKRTTEAARGYRPGVLITAAVFTQAGYILRQGQVHKNGLVCTNYHDAICSTHYNFVSWCSRGIRRCHSIGSGPEVETPDQGTILIEQEQGSVGGNDRHLAVSITIEIGRDHIDNL